MSQIKSYFPTIYQDIKEINELCNAEQPIIDDLNSELKLSYNRNYVATADETGVKLYEKLLNIQADINNESISFRKERILFRLMSSPPFTINYLIQQLDKIIGKNKYEVYLDYNNYKLYIKTAFTNDKYLLELKILLAKIKPANIIYIFVPSFYNNILLKEYNTLIKCEWKYKLGSWELGVYNFLEEGEKYNMSSNGISEEFINLTAREMLNMIYKVVVNDYIEITTFEKLEAIKNKVDLSFTLPDNNKADELKNVKIYDYKGNLIFNNDCYFQIDDTFEINIVISLKKEE